MNYKVRLPLSRGAHTIDAWLAQIMLLYVWGRLSSDVECRQCFTH
jgi:hypothetical protein